jgi:hypothetical protein
LRINFGPVGVQLENQACRRVACSARPAPFSRSFTRRGSKFRISYITGRFAALSRQISVAFPTAAPVRPPNKPFLVGHAFGTQNYVCLPSGTEFKFKLCTPQATLRRFLDRVGQSSV